MKSIAKIKDYFKNLKEEKMQKSIKRQKEIAQKQEQKQMALDILSVSNDMQKKMDIKIKYGVNYGNTKKNYCRTIDEHNMEILFCNLFLNQRNLKYSFWTKITNIKLTMLQKTLKIVILCFLNLCL